MNYLENIFFEWLLVSTLKASVLAVMIIGLQFILRRWLSATWRHALWLPMLAVMILPAVFQVPFTILPQTTISPAPIELPEVITTEKTTGVTTPIVPSALENSDAFVMPTVADEVVMPVAAAPLAVKPTFMQQVTSKLPIYASIWFVGACIMFVIGFIGYHRNMQRITRTATTPDRLLLASIAETAREAGLKQAPNTMISPDVASPAVTGFTRPVLLLPTSFPEGFSPAEARLILLHEFTHLKRYDLPLNWLMCVLQAIHWFNPLLWFAFSRMRADREIACDARVLSIDTTDRRAEYGGALLKLQCVASSRMLSLGFVGIFERGSEIKSRIREIAVHRPGRVITQIAGGVIFSLLMAIGITKAQQSTPDAEEGKIIKESASSAVTAEKEVAPANAVISSKLDSIVIPVIEFGDVSLREIVDFLRYKSRELDIAEKDPAQKGFDFVIELGPELAGEEAVKEPMIRELQLRNVSLAIALKYVCGQVNYCYHVDKNIIVISPRQKVVTEAAKPVDAAQTAVTENKLKSLIIPKINFDILPIDDAIAFLRIRSNELDVAEKDSAKKGINFVIQANGKTPEISNVQLTNVSIETALKVICDQTNLDFKVDGNVVTLAPKSQGNK
jgi:bla regulator protein blaR1